MAIFGSKKKNEASKEKIVAEAVLAKKEDKKVLQTGDSLAFGDEGDLMIRPRITEKATLLSEKNVVTFEIGPNVGKGKLKKAIKEIYKVDPVKVNIAKNPRKKSFSRGKVGYKNAVKKAYVFLKEGDSIEL